jgi:hypothetical protein
MAKVYEGRHVYNIVVVALRKTSAFGKFGRGYQQGVLRIARQVGIVNEVKLSPEHPAPVVCRPALLELTHLPAPL